MGRYFVVSCARRLALAAVGAGVMSGLAGTARAESFPSFDAAYDGSVCMHPRPLDSVLPPPGTVVPANLPYFEVPWNAYRLVDRATGDEIPTTLRTGPRGYFLLVDGPLPEGGEIGLQVTVCMGTEGILAAWTVGPAITEATSLGTLRFSELRAHYAHAETEELVYFVGVSLVPDPALAPWQAEYAWWLDGDRPEAAPLDREIPTFVSCREPEERVEAMGHGGLFPFEVELSTPPQTARVDCTVPPVLYDTFGGRPLTESEIEELARRRAARAEAGVGELDAAVASDAGRMDVGPLDGGSATMPTEPDTNGHCSARGAGRGADRPGLFLALFALAAISRRRGWHTRS
ncbi:MAG: hypothetical protein OHK0013_43960 [Sandaracinaceae bacterium]